MEVRWGSVRIRQVIINNYRNLDDIKILLNPTLNFLVGENNLGKTNFLDMLDTLFNGYNFKTEDFYDINYPIEIELSIILDDVEKGVFDDLFDPEHSDCINIYAKQLTTDDNIKFFHKETGNSVPSSTIKCINYINYDSLRNPTNEINFDKNKGVGKFLNYIITAFLEKEEMEDKDFINKKKVKKLTRYINRTIGDIKAFKDFSIKANTEDNVENLLSRIIVLNNNENRRLQELGYGVQFFLLIILAVLEKLVTLSKARLAKCLFEDEEGDIHIPLVMGLDEPEIHLHPYMQRSLIKYLIGVIENRQQSFNVLLEELFNINNIIGQMIVVTHSPNIILNNYRNIIRFYKDNDGSLKIKCGEESELDESIEKHLMKNLAYIKEAFFSRCVILVEGDSELGAFPIFAQRMEIDLDEFGISVIQAGSADSIPPLMELLNYFGIRNIGIMDKDKESAYDNIENLHFTKHKDFEAEVYSAFSISDYIKYVEEYDTENRFFFASSAKELAITVNLKTSPFYTQISGLDKERRKALKEKLRHKSVGNLRKNKTIINGCTLAETVTKIPKSYAAVLKRAKELAQSVE